jgi:Kdo2-lipid IVA lauroyltransferase/acyltransferase
VNTLISFLLGLLARLPRGVLQSVGIVVGLVNHFLNTRAARVTSVNLALCGMDPGLRKKSLIETGKTLLETPATWLAPTDRIDDWICHVHGVDLLEQAIESERGLLILLPHLGNWELINVFYRRYGLMTALYHPPKRKVMRSLMAEVRGQHGNEMVPTTRQGLARLYRALNEGRTVVVLPDQIPTSGRYIPFIGPLALTDELSVRLLKKTSARVLGLSIIRRNDGRFDIHILEPADEIFSDDMDVALTAMNELVEEAVRLAPAQYQWEYKRFRERPAGETKIYRFNKPPEVHS